MYLNDAFCYTLKGKLLKGQMKMNISALILLLEQKKTEHGDIAVLCLTTEFGEAEETELTSAHIAVGQLPKPGSAETDKVLIIS